MKTNTIIEQELIKKLNPEKVKEHPYTKFDYIPSWEAIDTANNIFGFLSWDSHNTELRELSLREVDGKFYISFLARVTIIVHYIDDNGNYRQSVKEDGAVGSGVKKNVGDAYDDAVKSAISDAEKRALRKFGNQFGLALYDHDRKNVLTQDDIRKNSAVEKSKSVFDFLHKKVKEHSEKDIWTVDDFTVILSDEKISKGIEFLKEYNDELLNEFRSVYSKHLDDVKNKIGESE